MLHSIGQSHLFQFFPCFPPEGTAGGGEEKFMDMLSVLSQHALENGAVLAVHGTDENMVLFGFRQHQTAAGHQGFLIGQGQFLFCSNGSQSGGQSCNAHHCHQHQIYVIPEGGFSEALLPDDHFGRSCIERFEFPARFFITDYDSGRMKFFCLPEELFHAFVSAEHLGMEKVRMRADHVQRLGADGTGRT